MLPKFVLVLVVLLTLSHPVNAKFVIKNCSKVSTQQEIKEAIRFFAKSIPQLTTEEYSYVRETIHENITVRGQVATYIAEEDRYEIDLTNNELANLHSVLFDRDVTIQCADLIEEFYCKLHRYNGFASTEGDTITLCRSGYQSDNYCNLKGLVAHEISHLADLPKSPWHKDAITLRSRFGDEIEIPRLDKVYKLGHAAKNLCHQQIWDRTSTIIDGVEYFTMDFLPPES